jgi:hypothetical protein
MIEFTKTTAIDNSGLQTVLELERLDSQTLNAEVAVSVAALAAFEIAVKLHKDGAYQVIATVAGDYATPVGFLWASDAGLATLGVGTGWFSLHNLESVYAVRCRANSSGAGSTVTVRGQMGAN